MDALKQVKGILVELQEDSSVSKNIKGKLSVMQKELENASSEELSLVVNKILCDLEEISSDINIPVFIRTQIWNLTSLLETVC